MATLSLAQFLGSAKISYAISGIYIGVDHP
jgi:hypothetical protein